jgi:predicted DCC family thiol-disulfide oxidoreductase YuxK
VNRATDPAHSILLYDGVCRLCSRLVRFSLKRDAKRRLHFASLQGEFAARILLRHGVSPRNEMSLYFVAREGAEERLSERFDAVICVLRQIGGPWSVAATLLRIVPKWLRDWGYMIVARNRYRVFGRTESCLLPEPGYRDRFLDLDSQALDGPGRTPGE